eukprot:2682918-Amphidinium_carterae.1
METVLMNRRPVFFDPNNWHAVSVPEVAVTLVMYTTARLPSVDQRDLLAGLGFRPVAPAYIMPGQISSPSSRRSSSSESSSSSRDDISDQPTTSRSAGARSVVEVNPPVAGRDDSSEDLPVAKLARRASDSVKPTISPTLPFFEEGELDLATGALLNRGGAPKTKGPDGRMTWEGSSQACMMKILTEFKDQAGAVLAQVHVSAVSKDAVGVALVNWSNWLSVSDCTSSGTLTVILPGHRDFESSPPAAATLQRAEIAMADEEAGKRFPRLVTIVQLGAHHAVPTEQNAAQAPQAPSSPVELLLELDARGWDGSDKRQAVRAFMGEAMQTTGAHTKLYGAREVADEDSHLIYTAKARLTVDEAKKVVKCSGTYNVFAKPATHCADMLGKYALIWLKEDDMASKPIQYLTNVQRQIETTGGLCRSHKLFGLRADPRLAGRVRAALSVQFAHQFEWNESVVPSVFFVVRGVAAALSDVEVAKVLHEAFAWNLVPLRRIRATPQGTAVWAVGAEGPPSLLHCKVGTTIVTIEQTDRKKELAKKKAVVGRRQSRAHNSGTATSSAQWADKPWSQSWDPWSKPQGGADGAWWKGPSTTHKTGPTQDAWARYTAASSASASSGTSDAKIEGLESRISQIEKSQLEQGKRTEERFTKVESEIGSLGSIMQSNFDKLFNAFEQRNLGDSLTRKAQRTDEHRGGAPKVAIETPLEDLDLDQSQFHILYVNPSTHKGHLDRMIEVGADVTIIGEANHVQSDMKSSRWLPNAQDGHTEFHLAWTDAVRAPRDQRVKGRASAGIVMASQLVLAQHPFANLEIEELVKCGRLLMRRVEFTPGEWLNIFAIYSPVATWPQDTTAATEFLTKVVQAVMCAPEEMSIIIGDFNLEFQQDVVSQAAVASGVLNEVSAILADDNGWTPTTYRTRSTATRIDRVLCTPNLRARIAKLTVCSHAATGAHLPVVLSIEKGEIRLPPVLKPVLEIPVHEGRVDPAKAVRWQLRSVPMLESLQQALDSFDLERAHYLWSSLWEAYLQQTAPEDHNWSMFTGRASAKVQFRAKGKMRQSTQVQTDAERELWRLLGIMQGHRQGRFQRSDKVILVGERLYARVVKRRSLPPLVWDCAEACEQLEAGLKAAIKMERQQRVTLRAKEWKAMLNVGSGMNPMARKMIRGPSPRLLLLRTGAQDETCPVRQGEALDRAWAEINDGLPDLPVHPLIWSNVRRADCHLPLITAADIKEQLRRTSSSTACGPDWWRPKELKALPLAALASLACLFNVMEACQRMPAPMMRGWLRPIPKSGCSATPLAVRPISILSLLHRTWSGVRYRQLQKWADQILDPVQSAFRPGRSTKGELSSLLMHLNRRVAARRPVYVGVLDLSKAFPRMNKAKSAELARLSGLPSSFVDMLTESCLGKSMQWKISGSVSDPKVHRRGTPQGCALSIMLFQILLAPVARALKDFVKHRSGDARVLVYADDIIIVCEDTALLAEAMKLATTLLESLDFTISVCKSTVSTIGPFSPPRVVIGDVDVPIQEHPDLFGSTLTTERVRLVAPNALPLTSGSRSVARWIKVKDRVARLHAAPIAAEGKLLLWRQLILTVLSYDPWVILPCRSAADSWTNLAISAIFTGVRGRKNKMLLAAVHPHQLNVMGVLLYNLARDVVREVATEPLEAFFQLDDRAVFFTPLSAFVKMAVAMGFHAEAGVLVHDKAGVELTWPPESEEGFLHRLRVALRQICLRTTGAPLQLENGDFIDAQSYEPHATLTRVQRNFLHTLHADAHRSNWEAYCPLCGGPGGLWHSLWECEERSLTMTLSTPPRADEWPYHFKRFGFLLSSEVDRLTPEELVSGQHFMTKVLLERRLLQLPLDEEERSARGPKSTALRVEVISDDEAVRFEGDHPESAHVAQGTPSAEDKRVIDVDELAEIWIPGQAASSTAMPVQLRAEPSTTLVVAGAVNEEVVVDPCRPTKRARRAVWNISTLPAHIEKRSDGFATHFFCLKCGCKASPQARSPFFKRHFNCTGESMHRVASRKRTLKSLNAGGNELEPNDEQILCCQWYFANGQLPTNLSQLTQRGPITCAVCLRSDIACNRKRCIKMHMKCLQSMVSCRPEGSLSVGGPASCHAEEGAGEGGSEKIRAKQKRGSKMRRLQ